MRAEDRREKIAVVVGTVTNDIRILTLPKLKVCTDNNYSCLFKFDLENGTLCMWPRSVHCVLLNLREQES